MSWWTKARDQVTGTVSKAAKDVGGFAWKGVKQTTSFSLNLVSLGAANKFTSVKKWSGTGFAGKAGTVVGITAAVVGGGYAASGLFAPVATGVGGGVTEGGALAVTDVSSFAAYDTALAEGAEVGVGSTVGTGGVIATGAGATASFLPSGSSLLGAGLLAKLFGGAGSAIGEKAGGIMNEVFGGSAGAPGSSGSSGGFAGGGSEGGGGIPGISKLPFIIIGIVLIGAYLLSRKRRK